MTRLKSMTVEFIEIPSEDYARKEWYCQWNQKVPYVFLFLHQCLHQGEQRSQRKISEKVLKQNHHPEIVFSSTTPLVLQESIYK